MSMVEKYGRRYDSSKYDHRDNGGGNGDGRHRGESKYDDPPHSRLFIVCGKSITEDDFKTHFSKYGTIEEVWMVKDRNTDEPKGVTYVKFSKTSEAALAMEEMNGRCIGSHPRPLKVLIAHSREQGSRREHNEEERLLRLFVVVPKTMNECDLRNHFADFGDIDYVSVVKDRNTKESKGFAYVKYHRMSHTAKAFENCDRSFKPVFADPKPQKDAKDTPYRSTSEVREERQISCYTETGGSEPTSCLTVIASPALNQDQLWKLFDLIPGLDYCDLRKDRKVGQGRGVATVVYNNAQAASYAREKLHGFEYPPGQRLIVKMESTVDNSRHSNSLSNGGGNLSFPSMPRAMSGPKNGSNSMALSLMPSSPTLNGKHQNLQQDLAVQLAETLAQATSLIQAAGLSQGGNSSLMSGSQPQIDPQLYDPYYCTVKLPEPQHLASVDAPVAERLFIVCNPAAPALGVLKDVFARFGNLIDIYILSGKTFGYAKYANKDSADRAIMALHLQEVKGMRLKVMEADPQEKSESHSSTSRKRPRGDDQN